MEALIEILEYLKKNHPKVDLADLYATQKGRGAVLATIKEFSGFGYDPAHKFFTRDIAGVMFATENVELENIHTLPDLFGAIHYLKDAYQQRYQAFKKAKETSISLPEKLYSPPSEVAEISRGDIDVFLKESYGIQNEKRLFELDVSKRREVIYGLYRRYTGYVPAKENGGIIYSVPGNKELKLRFGNLPDFEGNTSLFSYIREMRRIKENTKQMLQQATLDRMEQFRKIKEAAEKNNEKGLER